MIATRIHGRSASLALALLTSLSVPGAASAQSATGRIVATVTTLEGTVRMSGVQVELRTSAGRERSWRRRRPTAQDV